LQPNFTIQQITALATPDDLPALSELLIDCVEGGASVSFMQPLTPTKADAFWLGVISSAAAAQRVLLVARNHAGRIVGTVQVITSQPENQPHRADISKLLVHRSARCQGIAAALMDAADVAARAAGKSLLVLDTATGGGAESLYQRLGWIQCGMIPDYALWPQGGLCATTLFYKSLSA
jgi:GNAT superfamily N-acetyltransferase